MEANDKIEDILKENSLLKDDNEHLKDDNSFLLKRNELLTLENEYLKKRNEYLTKSNEYKGESNEHLTQVNEHITLSNEQLKENNEYKTSSNEHTDEVNPDVKDSNEHLTNKGQAVKNLRDNIEVITGNEVINKLKERFIAEILMLNNKGKASVSELKKSNGISRAAMQRDLSFLKSKGLITFVGYRKKGYFILTEKGRGLFGEEQ